MSLTPQRNITLQHSNCHEFDTPREISPNDTLIVMSLTTQRNITLWHSNCHEFDTLQQHNHIPHSYMFFTAKSVHGHVGAKMSSLLFAYNLTPMLDRLHVALNVCIPSKLINFSWSWSLIAEFIYTHLDQIKLNCTLTLCTKRAADHTKHKIVSLIRC